MSEKPIQRRGLGRGLGSLIPSGPPASPARETAAPATPIAHGGSVTVERPEADWIGRIAPPSPTSSPAASEVAPATGFRSSQALGDSTGGSAAVAAVVSDAPGGEPGETAPADEGGRELRPVDGAYFAELPVDSITPNPRQPRQVFDEEAMAELVHSVREVGLLQPVVVRPVGTGRYELVMGERRWRATEQAGLDMIPAIVRETGDDALLRDALLENLHRSQLNPLEEAAAYQQLLDDFGCTHEELATRIGRSRPQISNTLRLLRLSPAVQRRVAAGVLSAGHARTLLAVEDEGTQDHLAGRVVAEGISVRGLEEIVAVGSGVSKPRARRTSPTAPAADDLAARLGDLYDTRVKIELGRSKGRISIEFASLADLERIVAVMDPSYQRRHNDETPSRQNV